MELKVFIEEVTSQIGMRCSLILILIFQPLLSCQDEQDSAEQIYNNYQKAIKANSFKDSEKYYFSTGDAKVGSSSESVSYHKAKLYALEELRDQVIRDIDIKEKYLPFYFFYFGKSGSDISFKGVSVVDKFVDGSDAYVVLAVQKTDIKKSMPSLEFVLDFWNAEVCEKKVIYSDLKSIKLDGVSYEVSKLCKLAEENI